MDMTERKGREDDWFAEKERAEVTLHSIGDAVLSTGVDGRITYVNAAAERLTAGRVPTLSPITGAGRIPGGKRTP